MSLAFLENSDVEEIPVGSTDDSNDSTSEDAGEDWLVAGVSEEDVNEETVLDEVYAKREVDEEADRTESTEDE